MKKLFLFFIPTIIGSALMNYSLAQNPGEWMWIHGNNTVNIPAVFGTQGVSSPLNKPPGLYTACGWTDMNGNFWLFGGWHNGNYGDLWKYDPVINEWTWMKGTGIANDPGNYGVQGVSDPGNYPPARCNPVTWTDSQGKFWMWGGNQGGDDCDLWKYDPLTNEWTWMKGPNTPGQNGIYGTLGIPDPANFPGCRQETASGWIDAGDNLWLFGGYQGGLFNDLWKYSIVTNEWTWMKGSSTVNQIGIYGTLGIEDSNSVPGGRCPYSHWTDNSGQLWLWGGWDYAAGNFNDLWKYNPSTNNWTWMGGTNLLNEPQVLGTKCLPSINNIPECGWENRAVWKDVNGNFWFWGAGTYGGGFHTYNQLWKYCIASGEWTWISGDAGFNPPGNYGTLNVPDPANMPGGRIGSVGWTDNNGHLYLFGGESSSFGTFNDLWKFTIDSTCGVCSMALPVAALSAVSNHICPGSCTDFTNLSVNATSYQWNFSGATPDSSTLFNPTNICYFTPGNYDVTLIASNANGSDTLILANYITVFPQPPPQGIQQHGDTLLANPGAVSYQWYYNGNIIPGATDYFYVATGSGDYNVVATDENDCEVEAVINDVIASIQYTVDSRQTYIYPNPVTQVLNVNCSMLIGTATAEISIYNVLGKKINSEQISFVNQAAEVDVQFLSPGFYILEMSDNGKIFRSRFLKK